MEKVVWYLDGCYKYPVDCLVEKRYLKLSGMKWCCKCQKHHKVCAFNRNAYNADGCQNQCRACDKETQENIRARRKGKK